MRLPSFLGSGIAIASIVCVASPALARNAISVSQFPNPWINRPYSNEFQVYSTQQVYVTLNSGTLPPGMYINKLARYETYSLFELAGTPSRSGMFPFQLRINDGGSILTQDFSLTVIEGNLDIVPGTLRNARVGSLYSQTVSVNSSISGSVYWSITRGTLPEGLSLRETTGEITGTPTRSGQYEFSITGTDSLGRTGTRDYVLTIDPTNIAGGIRITSRTNPLDGRVGAPYTMQTYRAEGGSGYAWSLSGTTPPGLSIDPLTGVFGGIATVPGTYSFFINVSGFNQPQNGDQLYVSMNVAAATTTADITQLDTDPVRVNPVPAMRIEETRKQEQILTPRQKMLWRTFETRWKTVRARVHATVIKSSRLLPQGPFKQLENSKEVTDFALSLEDLNDEIPSYQALSQTEMEILIRRADTNMTKLGLLLRDTSKNWSVRDRALATQLRNDLINTRASLTLSLQAFTNFRRATPLTK